MKITGTGAFAPEKVLTNQDLEKIVNTSDEWIRTRTGILERRIAGPEIATSDMAYEASLKALEAASTSADDLDGIIVGTVSPDYLFPSTACLLQSRLKAKKAFAFDLLAGCSGFLYALQVGKGLIESGDSRKLLIIGAETLSRILDFKDRATCILFGDGAGAAVLTESDTPGIISSFLGANGDDWEYIYLPGGGARIPATVESVKKGQHFIKMKGNDVFKHGVKALEFATLEVIKRADITPDQIDYFIPHQANLRIIEAVRKRLKLPSEKVYVNVDKYGNTSSASIPIALDEAVRKGKIKSGDIILMSVIGAGFTWASTIIKWQ